MSVFLSEEELGLSLWSHTCFSNQFLSTWLGISRMLRCTQSPQDAGECQLSTIILEQGVFYSHVCLDNSAQRLLSFASWLRARSWSIPITWPNWSGRESFAKFGSRFYQSLSPLCCDSSAFQERRSFPFQGTFGTHRSERSWSTTPC